MFRGGRSGTARAAASPSPGQRRRRRRVGAVAVGSAVLAAVQGCSDGVARADFSSARADTTPTVVTSLRATPGPSASSVRDDRGLALPAVSPRRRVVSLVPSLTEVIVALGGADALVGRTRFDELPSISHVPSVGGTLNPDVEAILGLRPDLVVTWSDADARALTGRFEELGVPVYAARSRSIADFERHTRALATLLGDADEGDALVERVRSDLSDLREEVEEHRRPSVLFVVWPRPLLTTGRGTFVDELIRTVGGRGTFDDLDDPWPTVSLESVLDRRPDLVVIASEHAAGLVPQWIERDPAWRTLDAVRRGHVHLVDADLFNRPGPRMVEAARLLNELVDAVRSGA